MKTGKCKFGASCKFHHPKDIPMSLVEQESGNGGQAESIVKNVSTSGDSNMTITPYLINQALFHNSKGLPIRPVIYFLADVQIHSFVQLCVPLSHLWPEKFRTLCLIALVFLKEK